MTSDTNRNLGIEMEGLSDDLDAETYPVPKDQVLDRHGERELTLQDGSKATLESILAPADVGEFDSSDQLIHTIQHMVGDGAVGETGQTGRGTSGITPPSERRPPGQPEDEDQDPPSL